MTIEKIMKLVDAYKKEEINSVMGNYIGGGEERCSIRGRIESAIRNLEKRSASKEERESNILNLKNNT